MTNRHRGDERAVRSWQRLARQRPLPRPPQRPSLAPERGVPALSRLIQRGGFPPIRRHDLRDGAATITLEAGIDIKVVSEQLGHSTTTLTRDTYQSVAKELHHEAAGAVADRIKVKRRNAA